MSGGTSIWLRFYCLRLGPDVEVVTSEGNAQSYVMRFICGFICAQTSPSKAAVRYHSSYLDVGSDQERANHPDLSASSRADRRIPGDAP